LRFLSPLQNNCNDYDIEENVAILEDNYYLVSGLFVCKTREKIGCWMMWIHVRERARMRNFISLSGVDEGLMCVKMKQSFLFKKNAKRKRKLCKLRLPNSKVESDTDLPDDGGSQWQRLAWSVNDKKFKITKIVSRKPISGSVKCFNGKRMIYIPTDITLA